MIQSASSLLQEDLLALILTTIGTIGIDISDDILHVAD
jgi:hypothetical protein